jgi:hypothetical protein
MISLLHVSLALALILSGCEQATDECFADEDCPDGQECVVTHDHEGDDHDHGGSCETPDTAA